MSDTLFPLDFPPGIYHNGTKTQAAGRWYDGNQVRFFQKTIQPIGGWVQLPTTGAAITGTPNAALAMTRNDGAAFLIIGTTTGLFAMNSSFVVSDITPALVGPGGIPRTDLPPYAGPWQLATFGSYVVATHTTIAADAPSGISTTMQGMSYYVWTGTGRAEVPLIPTIFVCDNTNSPSTVSGLAVTPERFLMLFRGADPTLINIPATPDIVDGGGAIGVYNSYSTRRIYWATQETVTDWQSTDTNSAGSFDLPTDGALVTGLPGRGETLIWSTTDLWAAAYIGAPFYYAFERKGQNCGIISPHAAVVLDSGAYWWGPGNRFYHYDHTVTPLECEVSDFIASTIGTAVTQIFAFANPQFGEITWFYPSASNVNDRYVTYNYLENHWTYGTMNARTAGVSRMPGVLDTPLLVLSTGAIALHEFGNGSRSGVFLDSGPLKVGDGDNTVRVQRVVPDDKTLGDVNATLFASLYPDAAEISQGPFSLANPTSVRLTGRQFRVRLSEVVSTAWRIGKLQLGGILQGKR